jgi:hypothetical protein
VMLIGSIAMTIHHYFRYGEHKPFQKRQISIHLGSFSPNQDTPWYQLSIHSMGRMAWCKVVLGVAMVNFMSPAMNNYAIYFMHFHLFDSYNGRNQCCVLFGVQPWRF